MNKMKSAEWGGAVQKVRGLLVLVILLVPSVLMAQHEELFLITEHDNSLIRMLREGNILRFYENTYNLSMGGNT